MSNALGSKVVEELKQLFQIALYLYVCLGALLLYASTVAGARVEYAHLGYAAVKALILAKFILMGHWFHLGEGRRNRLLIYSILYQLLAIWLLLIVLSLLEQFVEGAWHGHSFAAGLAEVQSSSFSRILAQTLILFLVLFPYIAIRQLSRVLGPGRLKRIFFSPEGDAGSRR
jgi:hypothetical protein